jgi:hypothetical protein
MKRYSIPFAIALAFGGTFVLWALLVNHALSTDHGERVGVHIHQSMVMGYRFDYYLINLPKRETQHMMVYVVAPDGHSIDKAEVGFLVVGPDGSKQRFMAMGMDGAFGADIDFRAKGVYTVKTKVVTGGKKMFDKFTYEAR